MSEWALITFTLALQLSCGLALSLVWLDLRSQPASDDRPQRRLGIALFPVVAAGLAVSTLHLGRPWMALLSLSNLRDSWISIEVLISSAFALSCAISSWMWWTGRRRGRSAAGIAAGILGLAAVFSSAMIYAVPAVPVWNSGWVPVSFLGTALLLGVVGPLSFAGDGIGDVSRKGLLLGSAAAGLLLLISGLWMLAAASSASAVLLQSLLSAKIVWVLLYMILAGVLPVAFAFRLWGAEGAAGTPGLNPAARRLMGISVITGTVIGRCLMYWAGNFVPPF